jgi:hypothetical protein
MSATSSLGFCAGRTGCCSAAKRVFCFRAGHSRRLGAERASPSPCRTPMHVCAHFCSNRPIRTHGSRELGVNTSDWRCDAPLLVSVQQCSPVSRANHGAARRSAPLIAARRARRDCWELAARNVCSYYCEPVDSRPSIVQCSDREHWPFSRHRNSGHCTVLLRCYERAHTLAGNQLESTKRDGLSSPHAPSCPRPLSPIAVAAGSPSSMSARV